MSDEPDQLDGMGEWEMREGIQHARRIAQGLKFMGEVQLAWRVELAATRGERFLDADTDEARIVAKKQFAAIVLNSVRRAVEDFEKRYPENEQ